MFASVNAEVEPGKETTMVLSLALTVPTRTSGTKLARRSAVATAS